MNQNYVFIAVGIAIVIFGIFLMSYFTGAQSYNSISPLQQSSGNGVCGDQNKARELAERSIGPLTIGYNDYQFEGVSCSYGQNQNGTFGLKYVEVHFISKNFSPKILSITEDPQLTKVISTKVIASPRSGVSTG